MTIFAELRSLVLLRRIAIALERSAAVAEARLAHDQLEWDKRNKKPSPTEYGTFDVLDANKRWLAELEASEFGAAPPEDPR